MRGKKKNNLMSIKLKHTNNEGISISGFKSSQIFEEIEAGIKQHPEITQEINAVYEFLLTNESGKKQSWTIDLKNGNISAKKTRKSRLCTYLE